MCMESPPPENGAKLDTKIWINGVLQPDNAAQIGVRDIVDPYPQGGID